MITHVTEDDLSLTVSPEEKCKVESKGSNSVAIEFMLHTQTSS